MRALAVLVAVALLGIAATGPGTAGAATPAQQLAARLKASMQRYYVRASPKLELGAVTCKIAASGKSARCVAHFAVTGAHAVGDFVLGVTIDRKTGRIHTKTLSAACRDTKTGKILRC
jgi:hypothetical protein